MTCKRRPSKHVFAMALGVFGCVGLIPANVSLAQDIPTATHGTRMTLGTSLSLPGDVGVGKEGRIHVVDGGNHQLAVFDTFGVRIGTLGEQGSEAGQFESPVGLGRRQEIVCQREQQPPHSCVFQRRRLVACLGRRG